MKKNNRQVSKIDGLNADESSNKRTKENHNSTEELHSQHLLPSSVSLSKIDKARQIVLSADLMTCYGARGGFRMVRASHGVHLGSYFYEAHVLDTQSKDANDESHVRIGWSTRQGELQGPVGYDRYSYAYRDVNGAKVHKSFRDDTYGEPFGAGDVIGCFIRLSNDPDNNEIRFFKNGKDLGMAYSGSEIPSGVYFPAISLFGYAQVNVNFGPSFILRYNTISGSNAVSEVQPMSPQDRKLHDSRIAAIRKTCSRALSDTK